MIDHDAPYYLSQHDKKCPGFYVIPYKVDKRTVAEYCNKCGVWLKTHNLGRRKNRYEFGEFGEDI
jgi:hypothetical protein